MRFSLLILVIFASSTLSYGQSKKEQIITLQKANSELEKTVDFINHELAENQEKRETQKRTSDQMIARLKKENEELRRIMRGYVYMIDSLNTANLSLKQDLDEVSDNKPKGTHTNNSTTTENPDPRTNSNKEHNDPFGSGGNVTNSENHFGNGNANGTYGTTNGVRDSNGEGGSGVGMGPDSGPGSNGSGNGTGGEMRKLIKNVHSLPDYDHAVKFRFKVTIDAAGNVISVMNIKGSTTTTDQVLINKVRQAVIKQVKYSKAPGAPAVTKIYNFKLQPK